MRSYILSLFYLIIALIIFSCSQDISGNKIPDQNSIMFDRAECFSNEEGNITISVDENIQNAILIYEKQKVHFVEVQTNALNMGEGRPLEFTSEMRSKNASCEKIEITYQGAIIYGVDYDNCGEIKNYEFSSAGACSTNTFINFLVKSDRAYIHKLPSKESKKKSYFIKGDSVEALDKNDDWIKVSYKNDTKTGWLKKEDLELVNDTE